MLNLSNEEKFLRSGEVAKLLNVSNAWCEYHRRVGGGPPYIVLGTRSIRYPEQALRAWIDSQKRVNNCVMTHSNGGHHVSY